MASVFRRQDDPRTQPDESQMKRFGSATYTVGRWLLAEERHGIAGRDHDDRRRRLIKVV
jgi:hypothetical protein